ncbi:MAG: hypothetical protein A2Y10_13980 [Planctomycetes bacterium GWF2_41_51]|nr:MAG: hypothetical protein A2Y10_13980 [Planctomycetes bacterium GWF2_41_51]
MNNNCILTVVPSKWLCRLKILFSFLAFTFLFCTIYLIAAELFTSLKLIFIDNIITFLDVGLLFFFILLLLLLFFYAKLLSLSIKFYKTKMEFFDDYIVFTNKSGFQYKISKSDTKYIFALKRKTSIIFQNEQLLYFVFSEKVYGSKQLKNINEYFSKSDIYFDDKTQIRKIIKDNNLQKSFHIKNSINNIVTKKSV